MAGSPAPRQARSLAGPLRPAPLARSSRTLELAPAEVGLLQADVVVDALDRELGARLLGGVAHRRGHRGPHSLDPLEALHGVALLLLGAAVVDIRLDDDEGVLEDERYDAGEARGGILSLRFEAPRRLP